MRSSSFCLARKEFVNFLTEFYKVNFIVYYTSVFTTNLNFLDYMVIMASPGSLKGQRRGTCGHAMAAFDLHEKCARCREKKIGEDQCVKGLSCSICEGFSEAQRETLSTPSYKIRKEKRAGSLVSPQGRYYHWLCRVGRTSVCSTYCASPRAGSVYISAGFFCHLCPI